MAGRLFLVATPIGNLADLGFRALEVLREVDVIACEDTRSSRVLLDHHDVRTPTTSLHAHSTEAEREALLVRLDRGDSVALISDAGTPLVSDPGGELVVAARARGAEVIPIPGPSAVLAALVGSGLDASRFVFLGFLPRREGEQVELLAPLRSFPGTVVVFESPRRVGETLATLARVFGAERRGCLARELTKRFESFVPGTLAELAAQHAEGARGEVVLLVGPPEGRAQAEAAEVSIQADILKLRAEGMSAGEIAKIVAGARGLARKEVYRAVLETLGEVSGRRGGDGSPPG